MEARGTISFVCPVESCLKNVACKGKGAVYWTGQRKIVCCLGGILHGKMISVRKKEHSSHGMEVLFKAYYDGLLIPPYN